MYPFVIVELLVWPSHREKGIRLYASVYVYVIIYAWALLDRLGVSSEEWGDPDCTITVLRGQVLGISSTLQRILFLCQGYRIPNHRSYMHVGFGYGAVILSY